MPLIRCMTDASYSGWWTACYSVLVVYFFLLLLYCIIPAVRHRLEFWNLSVLNRWTRFGFGFALTLKFLSPLLVLVLGHMAAPDFNFSLAGILCCELPSYVVASCYTLVLMFWLSICTQVLPVRYGTVFRVMRAVLIGYNVLAYAALATTAAVLGHSHFTDHPFREELNGIAALCRDFVLGVVFMLFVIILKIGLLEDASTGASIDERKLLYFTIVLSVFLLLRGGAALAQGLAFMDAAAECGPGFLAIVFVMEIVIEGWPFIFLIRVHNDFLVGDEEEVDSKNVIDTQLLENAAV
jgi:hypothetical protein